MCHASTFIYVSTYLISLQNENIYVQKVKIQILSIVY